MKKSENKKTEYFVKTDYGTEKILELYESFTGWYWYITEIEKQDPRYAYGFVKGFENEWGSIWLPEIETEIKKGMVWKVPKENWGLCPFVVKK